MKIHNITQGTPEWHAFRRQHFNASEAAAMLGMSPYMSRNELLKMKKTGIAKEVNAATQQIFDNGHATEAAIRPHIEVKIGQDLYPVTVSDDSDTYGTSFDGLTMDEETGWEHKQWNESLAESVRNGILPEEHCPQVQQQLMMGLKKVIFTVSDGTLEKCVSMEVYPDQAWFDRITAGWAQFEKDLETFVQKEVAERPQAEVMIELPALFIQAQGEITTSNMKEYGNALTKRLEEVRSIALVTDQDFSNAKSAAAMFREQIQKLKSAKEAMLSQTATIGEASRMIDAWMEDMRLTALQLEKNVEREDLAKKRAMIADAAAAFVQHVAAISTEITPIQLVVTAPDFLASIKGKRNYKSMQDEIDADLANGKIAADKVANDIKSKLTWYNEEAADYLFLFADLQTIIYKPMDDFKLVVTTRIDNHKKAEAEKDAKAAAEAAAQQTAAPVEQVGTSHAEVQETQPAPLHTQAESSLLVTTNTISEFIKVRNFGRDESRIRSILVEFVKFQQQEQLKKAA